MNFLNVNLSSKTMILIFWLSLLSNMRSLAQIIDNYKIGVFFQNIMVILNFWKLKLDTQNRVTTLDYRYRGQKLSLLSGHSFPSHSVQASAVHQCLRYTSFKFRGQSRIPKLDGETQLINMLKIREIFFIEIVQQHIKEKYTFCSKSPHLMNIPCIKMISNFTERSTVTYFLQKIQEVVILLWVSTKKYFDLISLQSQCGAGLCWVFGHFQTGVI